MNKTLAKLLSKVLDEEAKTQAGYEPFKWFTGKVEIPEDKKEEQGWEYGDGGDPNGSQSPYLLKKAGYENLTEAGDVIWVKLGYW